MTVKSTILQCDYDDRSSIRENAPNPIYNDEIYIRLPSRDKVKVAINFELFKMGDDKLIGCMYAHWLEPQCLLPCPKESRSHNMRLLLIVSDKAIPYAATSSTSSWREFCKKMAHIAMAR